MGHLLIGGFKPNHHPHAAHTVVASQPEFTTVPAPTTTTTRPLTVAEKAALQVSPAVYEEWKKVNKCEEGGNWHVEGSQYSGGLGISNVNWALNRPKDFPADGGQATPDEQILVAEKIQSNPPDQNGCDGSW